VSCARVSYRRDCARFADLVAFRADPLTCDLERLPELKPVVTVVGGRPVFDPEGLIPRRA